MRLTRFRIVDARAKVQEQALSQVFDEVRARLRDARANTSSATHELQTLITRTVRNAQSRASAVTQKLSPARLQTRVVNAQARFETASLGCSAAMEMQLQQARERLGLAAASLDALSPLAVLQRGYAIAQDKSGALLRDAKSVAVGDEVRVRLVKGRLNTRVESLELSDEA